ARRPLPGAPAVTKNNKPLRPSAIMPSRASVVGGTVLALAAAAGWLFATRHAWRRRDTGRLVVLLVGLLAIAGQFYFAIEYPYETMGPVKGAYLQFAGPIYCATTGLVVGLLWKRRGGWPRLLA